jgi:hypothetical protein
VNRAPTWYSVTVEADSSGEWRLLDPPCTQVAEDVDELAEGLVRDYDLDEFDGRWRVRVYAGYNRYDELLVELSG